MKIHPPSTNLLINVIIKKHGTELIAINLQLKPENKNLSSASPQNCLISIALFKILKFANSKERTKSRISIILNVHIRPSSSLTLCINWRDNDQSSLPQKVNRKERFSLRIRGRETVCGQVTTVIAQNSQTPRNEKRAKKIIATNRPFGELHFNSELTSLF